MEFPILPYVGAGDLQFGMSPENVAAVLGPPSRSSTAFNGDRNDTYDHLHLDVGYAKRDGKLSHLGFSTGACLTVDGMNLFHDPSAMTKLIQRDGEPFAYLGFVVLLHLGILLERFGDGSNLSKVVALFPRGRWDDRRDKFRPLRPPE